MDRISGLPDDVTGHILSFLPTIKSLLETSTLSKAWRFRWTHATKIAYFRETPNSNTQKPYIISSTNFHISSPGTTTDSEFESWMIATALRNVRTLFIYLHHHLKLPPCLFASEMLVDLSLVDCGSISTSVAIHFPALRKLHLKNVVCENEQSLPHLLSRCPVLEELIVERMIFSVIEARWRAFFDVSSPTLTRVVLDLDKVYLTLDTPALRYIRLRLRQSMVSEDWATLDSLIEADIDLNEDKFERGRFTGESCYAFIVKKIVGRFCNAKCITLSTQRIPWPQPFALDVKFNNLTELKLSADCQIVTSFLVNANNLRLLTICRMVDHKPQHNRIRPNSLANCWRSHIDKAACLKSHLERVSVVDFEWARKQEFDMVSYILRYARVLKTMEIIYTPQYELDSDQKLEAHNKLASFERGSNICELVFV